MSGAAFRVANGGVRRQRRVRDDGGLPAPFLSEDRGHVFGRFRAERRFEPAMDEGTRSAKYARWGRAVAATMTV